MGRFDNMFYATLLDYFHGYYIFYVMVPKLPVSNNPVDGLIVCECSFNKSDVGIGVVDIFQGIESDLFKVSKWSKW